MIYKISDEIEFDFFWPQNTIANTSSLTPPDCCAHLPIKKLSASFNKKTSNEAPIVAKAVSNRLIQPSAMELFGNFLELILKSRYELQASDYTMLVGEDSVTREYFVQFGMDMDNVVPYEKEEADYFDPDLQDVVTDFLEDLETCLIDDSVTIDFENLAISFNQKIDFYKVLYAFTDVKQSAISSTDDIGITLENMQSFDAEVKDQQLAEVVRYNTRKGKEFSNEGNGDYLLVVSGGNSYLSMDHYLASAHICLQAEIFMPLSQILTTLCQEDRLALPKTHSTYKTPYYNFN